MPVITNMAVNGDLGQLQASVSGGGVVLEKMRRAYANPCVTDIMASPPTITVSAEGAATSISSGQNIATAMIDQWPIGPSGKMNAASIIDNSPEAPNSTGATTRTPVDYAIQTDGVQVEMAYRPDGASNSSFILYVDGVRASNVIAGTAFTGVTKRVLVEFSGSRRMRLLEFVGMRVPPDSFRVGAKDSIQFPTRPGLVAMVTGDSFTEGTGASCPALGFAAILPRLLGIRKVHTSGLGGTGYSGTSSATRKRLRYRWATDCAPYAADVIFHCNGVNDSAVSAAQLIEDASAVFDLAQASHPNAIQIVFTGFNARNSLAGTTIPASITTAVGVRPNFYIVNVLTENEIEGTGYVNAQSSTGNSNWVIGGTDGSDTTHPSEAGHDYLARWRAGRVARLLGLVS